MVGVLGAGAHTGEEVSLGDDAAILVLAAQRFEAQASLDMFEAAQRPVKFVELGIGALAAQRTVMTLPSPAADLVIYLGSCGEFVFGQQDPRVRLVSCRRVYWSPSCSRCSRADLIAGVDPPYSFENLHSCVSELECLPSFTSPTITLDPSLVPPELIGCAAGRAAQESGGTENMELYGVAPYLADARALILLLGVTNNVGWHGRRWWGRNHARAAELCCDFLKKHLPSLLPAE